MKLIKHYTTLQRLEYQTNLIFLDHIRFVWAAIFFTGTLGLTISIEAKTYLSTIPSAIIITAGLLGTIDAMIKYKRYQKDKGKILYKIYKRDGMIIHEKNTRHNKQKRSRRAYQRR